MSAQASTSTQQPPPSPPSPVILLFARATIATLDLWPALTIAVREQWGGRDSAEKKTWIASVLIDEFESRSSSTPLPTDDLPLDEDDIGDLLAQIMSDEFDANVEDGSIEAVAKDLVRVWKGIVAANSQGQEQRLQMEGVVGEMESRAAKLGTSVQATAGPGPEVDSDEESGSGSESEGGDDDDDAMDVDEAPQLVPARQEPVVDEDGFELVQKKGRR